MIYLLTAKPGASQAGTGWARTPGWDLPTSTQCFRKGWSHSAHSCVSPFSSGEGNGIALVGCSCSVPQGQNCTEGQGHPVGAHTVQVQMLGLV